MKLFRSRFGPSSFQPFPGIGPSCCRHLPRRPFPGRLFSISFRWDEFQKLFGHWFTSQDIMAFMTQEAVPLELFGNGNLSKHGQTAGRVVEKSSQNKLQKIKLDCRKDAGKPKSTFFPRLPNCFLGCFQRAIATYSAIGVNHPCKCSWVILGSSKCSKARITVLPCRSHQPLPFLVSLRPKFLLLFSTLVLPLTQLT